MKVNNVKLFDDSNEQQENIFAYCIEHKEKLSIYYYNTCRTELEIYSIMDCLSAHSI